MPQLQCQLMILDNLGQPVASLDSEVMAGSDTRDPELGTRIECEVSQLPLIGGRYRIDVALRGKQQFQDGLQAAAFFDVEPGVIDGRPTPVTGSLGTVVLAHRWRLPA